jgi:hypothetical protein
METTMANARSRNGRSERAAPSNKEMKLTSVERAGRSQLISGVRRLDAYATE